MSCIDGGVRLFADELRAEKARRKGSAKDARDAASIRKRCKTLPGFIREAWPVLFPDEPYVHGWHIDFICEHLEAITSGRLLALGLENRALFNVPPGTMKSLTVSVFWPAWEWGPAALPYLQAIATSYRIEFCKRDSQRFAKLVNSDWYRRLWPHVEVTRSNDYQVMNSRGGFRNTVPFGSLMGGRAHRLILDDPHSVDTAESDAERERATMRFREGATMRLNDPQTSAIVVIMQRLHENDISGVIHHQKMPYVHVMLPMRFEPERACVTPLARDPRTKDGELLFPERFPRNVVDRDEAALGSHATACQQQQRPTPRGGLLFKRSWFPIVDAVPEASMRWVRGWDLAASKAKSAAFTCGLKLGYDMASRRYFVGHVERDRVLNPEQMIRNVAEQDGKRCAISIPQDPGAAGKIQSRALVSALAGFQVHSSPESGEKEDRARPIIPQAEVGNIAVLRGAWNEAFLSELAEFPSGRFKDQVDAFSRAFGWFVIQPPVAIVSPIVVTSPIVPFGEHTGYN